MSGAAREVAADLAAIEQEVEKWKADKDNVLKQGNVLSSRIKSVVNGVRRVGWS